MKGTVRGPFDLAISLHENELVLDAVSREDGSRQRIALGLGGFRKIIKDYFAVCENYFQALNRSSPAQIEAVDMGRRSLHNEAAEMLRRRLARSVDVDLATARRLFTLLCVLQFRH